MVSSFSLLRAAATVRAWTVCRTSATIGQVRRTKATSRSVCTSTATVSPRRTTALATSVTQCVSSKIYKLSACPAGSAGMCRTVIFLVWLDTAQEKAGQPLDTDT